MKAIDGSVRTIIKSEIQGEEHRGLYSIQQKFKKRGKSYYEYSIFF